MFINDFGLELKNGFCALYCTTVKAKKISL